MRGEWISPEERLPEPYREVFVYYEYSFRGAKDKTFGIAYYLYYVPEGRGEWMSLDFENCEDVRVIAWTPLPTPPGEKLGRKKYAPEGQEDNWA